ncbi:MAG: DUF3427 domain-containing protein [Gammaproteobacteria bacterium]
MKSEGPEHMEPGLYEKLLAQADQRLLDSIGDPSLYDIADVDPENSHFVMAQFFEKLLKTSLSKFRGKEAEERQRKLIDRIVEEIGNDLAGQFRLAKPTKQLLAVRKSTESSLTRPDTPLSRSALFTGTRQDPSLASQLKKEIVSADRVDILCSFIKWSGLRLILGELCELTNRPAEEGQPRLRVITTSYMGVTDPKAVEKLMELANTEVLVSYDTKRTRLHAKAYLIHRKTGFGSAYVGSANLSHTAISEGLEWTPKISQYELPHLWDRLSGTFETYFNDDEFEPLNSSTIEKFRQAIERERSTSDDKDRDTIASFDLHPYPFQEEILENFAYEREFNDKYRHLLVAATGTGKTMVAAFDYKRWSNDFQHRPRLLFIAHREEILRQAMATYRAVIRDQNFGDLLVGGHKPSQWDHLFCSIQSYKSQSLSKKFPPEYFDYVVVDEFHHSAADSYQDLMDHVKPKVLLGMTATPERADGLDVFHWFGGELSAEIRLPDAISRRLLCPFQYFGVSDSVDLDSLTWKGGGYDILELDRIYTGDDVRAGLVLDKVREILTNPLQAIGLGFCVSVAHAEFMAKFFSDRGVPSLALSAQSSTDDRRAAQRRLVSREVNFLFVVDLYNEGVDIPEVDTVLFLRPTESLTIFLQQLGRGLRLHKEKDCLTVLDFIGAQHKRFRYASRLRALSTEPAARLDHEVRNGFPHLPAGCSLQMEAVAQQRVLENIRQSLQLRRPQMISELRELGRFLGKAPTLKEALNYLHTDLDELLKRGLWSRLLSDADLVPAPEDIDEDLLARGIRRLSHIDDPHYIDFLLEWLDQPGAIGRNTKDERWLNMVFLTLFSSLKELSLPDAIQRLEQNPVARRDLSAMLQYRGAQTKVRTRQLDVDRYGPLGLHGTYTLHEILASLGYWTMESRPQFREGCLHMPESKLDAFFITLNKTEKAYSPTTMYEDYALSDELFHWQSQSTTSIDSPTGQRYVKHREKGYAPILFVREHPQIVSNLATPYCFLGSAEHVSHSGSKPISITWKLEHPMPARLLRITARQATA